MVQLVGYYMWRSAARRDSEIIEPRDVEAGNKDAVSEFYEAVDAPLYYGLRSPQRLFIEAMAVDVGQADACGRRYRSLRSNPELGKQVSSKLDSRARNRGRRLRPRSLYRSYAGRVHSRLRAVA